MSIHCHQFPHDGHRFPMARSISIRRLVISAQNHENLQMTVRLEYQTIDVDRQVVNDL